MGMPVVTLRVTNLRRATHSGQDAERPERHTHAEHGYDSVLHAIPRPPIVPHAPARECRS
ncbi:hypothetical protein ALP23_101596 [Pseudomonas syringae pv. apii]|uniref:Uncharacterized protein n=1 Tax=Pseudomonas syringae pv. apii TaxID=81036 RepID=A0A3M5WSY4_9PSED|nr:hypothetical protein ALP23_101596 [Pseudomonas syringae pv. apii]